jgi:hypothetical protein
MNGEGPILFDTINQALHTKQLVAVLTNDNAEPLRQLRPIYGPNLFKDPCSERRRPMRIEISEKCAVASRPSVRCRGVQPTIGIGGSVPGDIE